MANALPPVKGAQFTTYIALVSQGDTDIFQTSVTLAAGDVQVSKDGGSFTNIATLPTEIGSTGVLAVTLSDTEMTADVVVVKFCDASGDEWQDALLVIYTSAQTLDTIDTNVDSILDDTGTDGVVVAAVSKTGYALASDGLDSIATTAPSGVASNFREMLVQVWRRFFKKATMTSTQAKTYADNDSDVLTTQTVSDDGTTQTQGSAS